jgi:hypothetical protein
MSCELNQRTVLLSNYNTSTVSAGIKQSSIDRKPSNAISSIFGKNVEISWTKPNSTDLVDGVIVLRKRDNGNGKPLLCEDFIPDGSARTTTLNDISANVVQVGSDITDLSVTSTIDYNVPLGNYWYAVFSYNSEGYSICDVSNYIELEGQSYADIGDIWEEVPELWGDFEVTRYTSNNDRWDIIDIDWNEY